MINLIYQNARNNQKNEEIINKAIQFNMYSELDTQEIPNEVIRMTIGYKGCNFIKKTENNNLFSIWFNNERNVIEFWGLNYVQRQKALNQINTNLLNNLKNYKKKIISSKLEF